MTLAADEFIRRFLIHTQPPGFQRTRYFGFLANRFRKEKLDLCRKLLANPITELLPEPAASHQTPALQCQASRSCPRCRTGVLIRTAIFPAYLWPHRPPDT